MGVLSWYQQRQAERAERSARRALLRSPDRFQVTRHRRGARNLEAGAESNLWSQWSTAPISVNRTIAANLTAIRARSRERAWNDPYAKRFVKLVKDNVVGPQGPGLRSLVRTTKGKPDTELREIIERAWGEFAGSKQFDMGRRLNFRAFSDCVMADVAEDGEAVVRIWRGPAAGPWGIGFQLIDANHLDVRYNADFGDGHRIIMGVEVDVFDRPIAYWFRPSGVDDIIPIRRSETHYRVPVEDLLHIYVVEKSTQLRGIPWFVSSITSMKMLHGYHHDAAKAARVGANSSLFVKSPSGDETVAGAEQRDDGSLEIEFDEDLIGYQLSDGEEVVSVDPRYPHEQFGDFTKAMLRRVSSGLNVPYPSLANDLEGVNFSSIRAGELEVREAWKALQAFLFDNFCSLAYHAWLEMALLQGKLRTKRGTALALSMLARLEVHSWAGKRWAWVDPLKDASANEKLYQLNALSLGDIIDSLGGDLEQTLERKAAELALMRRLGIAAPVAASSPATAPAAAPDPNDPDNGDDPDADPDLENGDGDAE